MTEGRISLRLGNIMFNKKGKVTEPLENPDFDALAEQMQVKGRLRSKNPFVLSSGLWLNVEARVDLSAKSHVVFSKELYEKLTPEERLAALAHEFAHIRERHQLEYYNRAVIKVLIYSPIFIALLPLCYGICGFFSDGPVFFSQQGNLLAGMSFTTFASTSASWFANRSLNWENLEVKADLIAAKYVGAENVRSVLSKIDVLRSQNHVPFLKRISIALEKDHPEVEERLSILSDGGKSSVDIECT